MLKILKDPAAFKHVASVTAGKNDPDLTDLQVTPAKECLQKCVQTYKEAVHMITFTDGWNIWTEMCAGSPNPAV